MFDIKNALKEWRHRFEDTEHYSVMDLDELENHVLEHFDTLKHTGLNDQEAFLIATHRLGQPEVLGTEYSKIHPNLKWQKRILWMLTGYITILAAKTFIGLLSKLVVLAGSFLTTDFQSLYFIELLSQGILLLLLGWMIVLLFFGQKDHLPTNVHFRLKPIYFIIIAFLISIGQFLPEYLRYWMASMHHAAYWKIWSDYGSYLTRISLTNSVIAMLTPLILFVALLILTRRLKRI